MVNYLPRVNTILNDQGLKIAPPPAGPKVTLLGITSNPNVPILEPYTVGSVEKAINTLYFNFSGAVGGWPSTNVPGELALAIEEAVSAGAPNIEVMVIGRYTGQPLVDYIGASSTLKQRFDDLSGAYDVLRNRELDVVVPVGAYIDDQIYAGPAYTGVSGLASTTLNFGKQLADFCYQATTEENSCVGVIATRPILSWAMRNAPSAVVSGYYGEYTGQGLGSDSVIKTELESLFGSVFVNSGTVLVAPGAIAASGAQYRNALASVNFGVPSSRLINEWHKYHAYHPATGVAAGYVSKIYDDAYYSDVYSDWLHGAANQSNLTLEDINVNSSTAVSSNYFRSWQARNSDGALAVDSRNGKVDAGAFISVFTAPLRSIGTQTAGVALTYGASVSNTSRNTDGAAAYAGLITSLAPQSSTTNKQMGGVVQLKLLSASQANDLVGMRHVTMYSRSTGLTIASGVTGAHNVTKYIRSDYVRLSTVRIVHATVDLIRSVANKYIGEPNNAPQMNALDAEIDQLLISMKGLGALNGYSFSISSTPDQRVLGELDINLTLVPAFEITSINLVVSLSKEI